MARKRFHTRRTARSNPRGTIQVRADGYAFVSTPEGDFFVPSHKVGGAFNGDVVEVAPLPRKGEGQPAARVVRVLDRAYESLVGRYEVAEPFGVVVPEDPCLHHDIFTLRADAPDVPDGACVRVRITNFPSRGTAATGVIEEVLANSWEQAQGSVLVSLIVQSHKLETEFSAAALAQAESAALHVEEALRQGYADLRQRTVFTIDPDDAKDFDDAVSLDAVEGGAVVGEGSAAPAGAAWRLGVHIADVSSYVAWDSSLDLDARRRATSVYLADRVIPMLPEKLSNDLCSLRPNEDRLVLTCDAFLDAGGRVVDCRLYPAVIRSCARLTYGQAQRVIDAGDGGVADVPEQVQPRILRLSALAKQRAAMRAAKGGIDFNTAEAKAVLDDAGAVVDIRLRKKTDATQLIEEAMILVNELVAQHMQANTFPCMYRVHEAPAPGSLAELAPVLSEFPWFTLGLEGCFVVGKPAAIQEVLHAAEGRSEEALVNSLVLRSMKRAVYQAECSEHFGLASSAYCHFTSPIRRYPDLVVHRMLKAHWAGKKGQAVPAFRAQEEALRWLAEHASKMEREAEAAARESQECKMAEYLQQFVGQSFSAVVSGVATYGFYVRLENTAEGLVPLSSLGSEYFSLDAARHTLTGEESGVVYRLGQRVAVVLTAADPRKRTIDFKLA